MSNAEKRAVVSAPPDRKVFWRIASIQGEPTKRQHRDLRILSRTWFSARDEALRRLAEKGYYYDRDSVEVTLLTKAA